MDSDVDTHVQALANSRLGNDLALSEQWSGNDRAMVGRQSGDDRAIDLNCVNI
jgi:hypothetical protein